MASDKRRYERAVDKWTGLLIEGEYSVPQNEGLVAVLVSNYPYNALRNADTIGYDLKQAIKDDQKDWEIFSKEAQQIAQELADRGIISEIINKAVARDVKKVIRDKDVTDIIIIGHGALSGFFIEGAKNDFFDWHQASDSSTHLKTGSVTQRHCGIFPRDLNAPLGMFLTDDMTRVRAATGHLFDPIDIKSKDNRLIRPVFNSNMPPSYDWIKENLRKPSPKSYLLN